MYYICIQKNSFMEIEQIQDDKLIYQSNVITSARYDFHAAQLDVFFMLLAMIEKGDSPEKFYNIHVRDIEALTGRKWNYQQMFDATAEMGSRMFVVYSKEMAVQLWMFRRVEHVIGSGCINIQINPEMIPYIFELKKDFTVFQLKSALSCSSKYAKRLYTLACQWRNVGIKTFEIAELKNMLSIENEYKQVGQLRERVLEVAKRQINEHTDIQFDYELIKRGRNFTRVKIYIGTQKPTQLQIDFKEDLSYLKNAREITSKGFTEEQAKTILKVAGIEKFRKAVAEATESIRNAEKSKKPVKNILAYLTAVLKNKGILPK